MQIPDSYKSRVENRSLLKYWIGYLVRLRFYVRFAIRRQIARWHGAKVGENSLIPWKLAWKANPNLIIGNNVSINSSKFILASPLEIHDNVIINRDVEIIRGGHDYNSSDFKLKTYPPLIIESYTWLATGSKVLPSCLHISQGTVLGAFSVLTSDTEENGVYSGFPAKLVKKKNNNEWNELVVVSLNAGDWKFYKNVNRSTVKDE